MARRLNKSKLRACIVSNGRHMHVGSFYFQTGSVIVLLNNTLVGAELVSLQPVRTTHAEPETDISVFPKSLGYKVKFVERKR